MSLSATDDMNDDAFLRLPRRIDKVHSLSIRPSESFVEIARRFSHLPGTVALLSGGMSDCARYHVLGIQPWLTLRGNATSVSIEYCGRTTTVTRDPFTVLQQLLRRYAMSQKSQPFPIAAGLLGYLSYDLKDCLEVLPRTSVDDLILPHLYMVAPSILVVEDRLEKTTTVHLPCLEGVEDDVSRRLEQFERMLAQPPAAPPDAKGGGGRLDSGFTREGYLAAVEAIRDYIARGHVYQVNMSQRFQAPFDGDSFALLARLFAQNPAPFFAFINAADHQIVSTSPERFVLLDGNTVETRPIKGTRPRGKTADEDSRLQLELQCSRKDEAELSMIVDLLRNDIGKVCRAGSVHVTEHKRIEAYENVYHLVSTVRGVLDDDKDAVDLIRATFPGGSITGCPKIRSMEIIDELEPVRRHIYTGSIGYISFHETMDLSIAIRTATVTEGKLVFSVGGGVVYDSTPSDEFEETLHKGRTLMSAFDLSTAACANHARYAWCNGSFRPVADIFVSVEDEGLQYGYGIFETLRVDRGQPRMLEKHLERFNHAWECCFGSAPPDVTWQDVIAGVVDRCGLSEKSAAIKILAAAGKPGQRNFDGTLLVTAKEYVHRLEGTARTGLRLGVYPHRRHSHLSDHKTTNYMFYKMAATWARSHSADEALILNADGSVSETNTANLFCVNAGRIYRPVSEHALPGTMEDAVCQLLTTWGKPVEGRRLSVQELKTADRIFVTNALMGAVPVTLIEDSTVAEDEEGLCRRINEALFG